MVKKKNLIKENFRHHLAVDHRLKQNCNYEDFCCSSELINETTFFEYKKKKTKIMETHGEIKLYKRRWLFMAVFVLYQINSSMQWIQFAIISDIIMKYYDVPLYYVEWTTDIYVLAYLLLLFPSLYILNKIVSTIIYLCGYRIFFFFFNAVFKKYF